MGRPRLTVLYKDRWFVAVDKPAGLLVHRHSEAPGQDTCLRRLRSQCGRRVYPCHRLDCATSGVLLFAFRGEWARPVFEAFEQRQVKKVYWALCRGFLQAGQEVVERPVDGRWARTEFSTLAEYSVPMAVGRYSSARYSLVEARPITGRLHQIRRHLSSIGHPIVGDSQHGDGAHNRFLREVWGLPGLFLAARILEFRHPMKDCWMSIEAPLRWGLQACLEQFEPYRQS